MMLRRSEGEWKPQYRFTLQSRELPEYQEMCHYHQTSPQSSFTRKRVCSLATETGRITLSDLILITTEGERREETTLAGEDEHRQALATYFGVVL